MCKGQQQDEDVFMRVLLCQSYQTTAIRRIWECANDLKPQKLNIPEPEIDNDSTELCGCLALTWHIESSLAHLEDKFFFLVFDK